MLPAGAFAVVLMLGGAQIMLRAPAFVEQGRVWAPGREVLQRLGLKVTWQADRRALVAAREGSELAFPELPPPWPVPATPDQALYARRVGNLLYIPLLALRSLGLKTTWEPPARRATIVDPQARPTSLAAILSDPLQWLGRTVTLTGEYEGWDEDAFCYATRPGPPVATGDWVLADGEGAIYCTPEPTTQHATGPGLTPARLPSPLLTPYAALGHRLTVTGRVALSPAGVPYLRVEQVAPLTGAEGVSCRLVLDQRQSVPGDTVSWEVVIYNPGPASLTLPADEEMLVSVAGPGGMMHVSKQSYNRLTYGADLAADDEIALPGRWTIPSEAPPGTYSIVIRLDDSLRTPVRRFQVADSDRQRTP